MKLAIVIPWFGRELKGGAEQQAWQIATRLAQRKHSVEILTTCCRSHQEDWATNHLAAGSFVEPEGFKIQRFPIDRRDRASFDRVCGTLLQMDVARLKPGVSPVSAEDSRIFAHELIKSKGLMAYLSAHKTSYDWFLFLPYLYGPILEGITVVSERAAFQPCLHDEAYAYLPQVADAFHLAKKILFNSDGEMELALRLFGPGIWAKSVVVGEGVEITSPPKRNARQTDKKPAAKEPFILYLGRKDPGKNVPLLLRAFQRFRATRPNSNLRLLLAGHGDVSLNGFADGVEDLGVVSEKEKHELLRACSALFQPSQNESFSRVMMEAWMYGRPVGAHAACLATAVAVERSGGGWLAASEAEWAGLFAAVSRSLERELVRVGQQGRRYAEKLADWDRVMERYEAALANCKTAPSSKTAQRQHREINQFLPNLSHGDAISNFALWIRNYLRECGYGSNIYARYIEPRMAHECRVFSAESLESSDAVIYHHSIGSEITPHLAAYAGPKLLIYHNITPAEFFAPFRPDFVPILQRGRQELGQLAQCFRHSCGVSRYNALELEARGFDNPTVLPIPLNPEKWKIAPDPKLIDQLQDGRTNILFVGRIAPNKKQDDLLRAFTFYLDFEPDARLILIGKREENDPYADHVNGLISSLGLSDSVLIAGSVTDAELSAYYRTAHLFWSMSEHEGFCVPLIEAMWFNVPVFAFKSSAVSETLGAAALMFTTKEDLRALAATAHLLITCRDLRRQISNAQQQRREHYLPRAIRPIFDRVLGPLVGGRALQENSSVDHSRFSTIVSA